MKEIPKRHNLCKKLEFSTELCYLQTFFKMGFVHNWMLYIISCTISGFVYVTKYIERRNRSFLDISDKFCENSFYS